MVALIVLLLAFYRFRFCTCFLLTSVCLLFVSGCKVSQALPVPHLYSLPLPHSESLPLFDITSKLTESPSDGITFCMHFVLKNPSVTNTRNFFCALYNELCQYLMLCPILFCIDCIMLSICRSPLDVLCEIL